MARVEPIVGEPAAVADLGSERALLVADVHAGIEVGLRYERGVELESRADERREHLHELIGETGVDRLVVLGDLAHRIAAPDGEERDELERLVGSVTERVPMTLVVGNHDGGVAEAFADELDVIGPAGGMLGGGVLGDDGDGEGASEGDGDAEGDVAVVHGHTWPDPALRSAEVLCMGHEHPQVKLEDAVGGSRTERAWLRGRLSPSVFEGGTTAAGDSDDDGRSVDGDGGPVDDDGGSVDGDGGPVEDDGAVVDDDPTPELVLFPAFNERSGGTWINVPESSFLSPFLPDGLPSGDAYLLDGTRLGDFRRI